MDARILETLIFDCLNYLDELDLETGIIKSLYRK